MTESSRVLSESLRMLYRKPRLFAPKIFSTLLSSAFILLAVSSTEKIAAMPPLTLLAIAAVVPVFITLVGVFASVMVASMVKNIEDEKLLLNSFRDAMGAIEQALKASFFFLGVGFLGGFTAAFAYRIYLVKGVSLTAVFAGLAILSGVIFLSYASYFLPATLLEYSSLRESFLSSYRSSNRNRPLVSSLVLFSLVLLGTAFLSSGYLEKLGYAGFLAGRLFSTVVNTYVFVISPNLYYSSPESLD